MWAWGRIDSTASPVDGPAALRQAVLFLALLALRAAVGLHPHSGQAEPPNFGDYEAQRHWMELGWHLHPRDWYRPGPYNDMQYWGIDYPPGSVWWSKLCAAPLSVFDGRMLALGSASRGFETPLSKMLMRLTVLVSDALILFPALMLYAARRSPQSPRHRLVLQSFIGGLPALLLIDHAHFQYNGVSLGLVLLAITSFYPDTLVSDVCAAIAFTTAVLFKHMSLYFAPAVAAILLGRLAARSKQPQNSVAYAASVAFAVAFTLVLHLWPWLSSTSHLKQMLSRLLPISRGLYEDKVANFWCSLALFTRINRPDSPLAPVLPAICVLATLLLAAPPTIIVARTHKSPRARALALAACAMAFFLMGYQVHEKQILLPLLPVAALLIDYPLLSVWTSSAAAFSMFPLLQREGNAMVYFALQGLQVLAAEAFIVDISRPMRLAIATSAAGALLIHITAVVGPTIPRYPDFYVYLFTLYSFAHFATLYVILVYELLKIHNRRD